MAFYLIRCKETKKFMAALQASTEQDLFWVIDDMANPYNFEFTKQRTISQWYDEADWFFYVPSGKVDEPLLCLSSN